MIHTKRHIPKPWSSLRQPPPGLSLCGVFVNDGDTTAPDAKPCEECREARELRKRLFG